MRDKNAILCLFGRASTCTSELLTSLLVLAGAKTTTTTDDDSAGNVSSSGGGSGGGGSGGKSGGTHLVVSDVTKPSAWHSVRRMQERQEELAKQQKKHKKDKDHSTAGSGKDKTNGEAVFVTVLCGICCQYNLL